MAFDMFVGNTKGDSPLMEDVVPKLARAFLRRWDVNVGSERQMFSVQTLPSGQLFVHVVDTKYYLLAEEFHVLGALSFWLLLFACYYFSIIFKKLKSPKM